MPSSLSHGARLPGWWTAATCPLGLVGLVGVGLQVHQHALAGLVSPSPRHGASGPVVPEPTQTAAPAVARSTPLWFQVPAINLSLPLTQLGLNADRTVQVPTDVQQPGWYQVGPSPGQVGSAVVLGHVDRGPAAFFRLDNCGRGTRWWSA